ncbi:MAG TPA: hypothetical protein VMU15_18980 [Anaeromyxobacter sp.]|nr:hypothetical protein [Anaeromyxobacter sp.]
MADPTGEHLEFDRLDLVERLCRAAREQAEKGDRSSALVTYLEAWEELPEPKESWEMSTQILSSVGDLVRTGGDLSRALEAVGRGKPPQAR